MMPDHPEGDGGPAGILTEYFHRLDAGDADGCAALFAAGARCLRQSLAADGGLLPGVDILEGREAIRDSVAKRGVKPYRHELRSEVDTEDTAWVEGLVRMADPLPSSLFLARAKLDGDGRILRYLAVGTPVPSDQLHHLR